MASIPLTTKECLRVLEEDINDCEQVKIGGELFIKVTQIVASSGYREEYKSFTEGLLINPKHIVMIRN